MRRYKQFTFTYPSRPRVHQVLDNPDFDRLRRPMRAACVHWLHSRGHSLDEIADFLDLDIDVVEALADVDRIWIGVELGPRAKLAKQQGLI